MEGLIRGLERPKSNAWARDRCGIPRLENRETWGTRLREADAPLRMTDLIKLLAGIVD